MKEVNARGQNCPMPVIMTKKALDELSAGEGLITIVDNEMAKENVSKFLSSKGLEFTVEENSGDFYLKTVTKENSGENSDLEAGVIQNLGSVKKNTVIFFDKDKIGHGNDELGEVLIKVFIYTLTEVEEKPSAMIFVNGGVKLTTEGSPVLEDIKTLEANGVEVLSCGTCLDYYGLKDKLEVGSISNMYTIVDKLTSASNTIKI